MVKKIKKLITRINLIKKLVISLAKLLTAIAWLVIVVKYLIRVLQ